MNITLSLEDDLVKKCRKIAVDRETTLTGLIRQYLQQLAIQATEMSPEEERRRVEALDRSFDRFKLRVGKIDWKREDLYERGTKTRK